MRRKTNHIFVIAERLHNSHRASLRIRSLSRPYTISITISRYAPNRKRSF